jgi:hypothetical protein
MLTTDQNRTQPYLFPREQNTFVLESKEMCEPFPESVVAYFQRNAALKYVPLPEGCHFLPQGGARFSVG